MVCLWLGHLLEDRPNPESCDTERLEISQFANEAFQGSSHKPGACIGFCSGSISTVWTLVLGCWPTRNEVAVNIFVILFCTIRDRGAVWEPKVKELIFPCARGRMELLRRRCSGNHRLDLRVAETSDTYKSLCPMLEWWRDEGVKERPREGVIILEPTT